jgi:sugar/nucleoside kinase (ribokinase family)
LPVSGRVVCLGEAVVDLVGARPADSLPAAGPFSPEPGGSLLNIAVTAARFGAAVRFLGGAGDDDWGRWLRDRLEAEEVDVSRFVLVPRGRTSLAFVSHAPDGEPLFHFHECPDRPPAHAASHVDGAINGPPGVVVLGSDSLLTDGEREVTMRAARLARERDWIVLADPNLRPARWRSEEEMLATVGELVRLAVVVKCNEAEATALTGEPDVKAAASALLELGPRAAAVTRAARGALLARGRELASARAADAGPVVDATGAGDSVTGVLAAALARGGVDALGPALPVAMRTAAAVVTEAGALAGLPADARAELGDGPR